MTNIVAFYIAICTIIVSAKIIDWCIDFVMDVTDKWRYKD